jgi:hypothetical protein
VTRLEDPVREGQGGFPASSEKSIPVGGTYNPPQPSLHAQEREGCGPIRNRLGDWIDPSEPIFLATSHGLTAVLYRRTAPPPPKPKRKPKPAVDLDKVPVDPPPWIPLPDEVEAAVAHLTDEQRELLGLPPRPEGSA